jgi:hypothetical protein
MVFDLSASADCWKDRASFGLFDMEARLKVRVGRVDDSMPTLENSFSATLGKGPVDSFSIALPHLL